MDAAEKLQALAIGLPGGLDHPLDDSGAACVADVDEDNVLELREQCAQENSKVKS